MIFPRCWVLSSLCILSLSCISYHVIMCITLHTCSSHASKHFSRCSFCIPALLCPPVSLSTSFHVRVLNIFGLDRDFPSGLGLLPVDHLSSFVPFGLRLILQRLTEEPKRPRVCCGPTPLQSGPNTPLHPLGRSITIAWPKTMLNLEPPNSFYV